MIYFNNNANFYNREKHSNIFWYISIFKPSPTKFKLFQNSLI